METNLTTKDILILQVNNLKDLKRAEANHRDQHQIEFEKKDAASRAKIGAFDDAIDLLLKAIDKLPKPAPEPVTLAQPIAVPKPLAEHGSPIAIPPCPEAGTPISEDARVETRKRGNYV